MTVAVGSGMPDSPSMKIVIGAACLWVRTLGAARPSFVFRSDSIEFRVSTSRLDWAAARAPSVEWVASVPGDCPFLPGDLVDRLHAAGQQAGMPLACAKSGDWRHPVVGLWPIALRADLRRALVDEDLRKIEVWTGRHGAALAEWPVEPVDPFFNVNTPEDAAEAARLSAHCA